MYGYSAIYGYLTKNMFWSAISDFYCGSFLVYDTLAMQIQIKYKFITAQKGYNCTLE